jgi:hypothetical protein
MQGLRLGKYQPEINCLTYVKHSALHKPAVLHTMSAKPLKEISSSRHPFD